MIIKSNPFHHHHSNKMSKTKTTLATQGTQEMSDGKKVGQKQLVAVQESGDDDEEYSSNSSFSDSVSADSQVEEEKDSLGMALD